MKSPTPDSCRSFRFEFAQHSPTTRSDFLCVSLGPLGFNSPNIAQRHALHVERTAEEAFMLSDRVQLSSAEARVEKIKGGSVGVFELIQKDLAGDSVENHSLNI